MDRELNEEKAAEEQKEHSHDQQLDSRRSEEAAADVEMESEEFAESQVAIWTDLLLKKKQ